VSLMVWPFLAESFDDCSTIHQIFEIWWETGSRCIPTGKEKGAREGTQQCINQSPRFRASLVSRKG